MKLALLVTCCAACGSNHASPDAARPPDDQGLAGDAGGGGDAGAPNATPECTPVTSGTFEHYDLPGPSGLPSGVTFLSDWSALPIAGGFDGKQAVDDCRMKPDGFTTWHGKPAVRVEVDPGDDPLNLGTERAELLSMQNAAGTNFDTEGASGLTLYYATSYYFPTSWDGTFLQGDGDSWSFVNQFYGWGGLAAGRRNATGPQLYWYSGVTDGTFSDGGHISLGSWTDFVIEVVWTTGTITIYRRDQGQPTFTQVLSASSPDAANCMYYKQGLYRGPDVNGRSDVLWIGPTARGDSFAAVEEAAFGTHAGF